MINQIFGSNLESNIEYNNKKLPKLDIGKYTSDLPIIQGGMGVGYSGPELAGNTALEGGMGTLTAAALIKAPRNRYLLNATIKEAKNIKGEKLTDQEIENIFHKQNIFCIKKEIKEAKEISKGKGAIFINIMHATNRYEDQVLAACEAGINGIVSGAGLPKELPELTKEYPDVANIPILSNKKGVELITRIWRNNYDTLPDAIILEELSAGGHLGTKDVAGIENDIESKLKNSIPAVKEYFRNLYLYDRVLRSITEVENINQNIVTIIINEFMKKTKRIPDLSKTKLNKELLDKVNEAIDFNCDALNIENNRKNKFTGLDGAYKSNYMYEIPVIAAGDMVNKEDILKKLSLGADGVQLGTRFLATKESTASSRYKQAIIDAIDANDIKTDISAVPLPSRFLKGSEDLFKIKTIQGDSKKCLFNCLKPGKCGPRDGIGGTASMDKNNKGGLGCITDQLAKSNEGGGDGGLEFVGKSALRINKIKTVKEIMDEFKK